MATIISHTTRAPGTILTAAIYNGDHQVHVTNADALNTQLGALDSANFETGTWTPQFAGATTAGVFTYTTNSGNYVKLNTMVWVGFDIDLSAITTAPAGGLRITGLPFTPSEFSSGGVFSVSANIAAVPTNFCSWLLRPLLAGLAVRFLNSSTGAIADANSATVLGATTSVEGSIIYMTS